jgi:N-acetylneuraminate lyase
MSKLTGIFSALLTPFDEHDKIDRDSTARLVDFQVRQGVSGLYVGGSSGEAMLQSVAERAEYLKLVADANSGRLELIAHVGSIATRDALDLSETAHRLGYHAISAVTPYYYSFSRPEVMDHYHEVATTSPLPLIIYNFPAATAGFSLAELTALLAHPRIIGVKHTSTDMFALEKLRRHNPDALIYNGYDEMCLAGLATGAQGAIGTTYNFMGDLFVALATEVATGRLSEARRLQCMANVAIEALIECGVLPSSKIMLEIMGVKIGLSRKPFRRVNDEERKRLRLAIEPVLAWRAKRTTTARAS